MFSLLIKELELVNYTNYARQHISFSPHINILIGANAQGKSNLIDSVFFLGFARSHCYPNDATLIRWGQSFFRLKGLIQNRQGLTTIEHAVKKGQKIIKVNGSPLTKIKDLLGQFTTIIFTPDDLTLLKGGPELRRKFLNRKLIQLSPVYYDYSLNYQRVLQQRNTLLKKGTINPAELEIWDEKLSYYGSLIINARHQLLTKLAPTAQEIHSQLTGGQEKLLIRYEPNIGVNKIIPSDIRAALQQNLTDKLEQDLKRGYTSVGPHRDDFSCLINDADARIFASQGQQRTAVLTLKLAMLKLMAEMTGEYPVLLLDDVFSELDQYRREYLLNTVSQTIQTIITATELGSWEGQGIKAAKIFTVCQGKII